MAEVYVNSKLVGEVDNPNEFIEQLRDERRKSAYSSNVNVYLNETTNDIFIETSKGRARKPVIVVKDGKPLLTDEHVEKLKKNEIEFNDLVKEGIIEYLDASEEENCLIAFYEKDLTPEQANCINQA
jgi:DNA-directed RNA polymerase subunit B'